MTLDLSSLRSTFSGSLLVDGDDGFAQIYYPAGSPALVTSPRTVDDVAAALAYARSNDLTVSVRSGGHSGGSWTAAGGGLVIDMSAFAEVQVDGHLVTVGTGATWGLVAETLRPHHLAISSGDTKSVGVGGLTLGGGVGWMVRKYGLALDSLVSARIVSAAGRLVTASEHDNADLFWAIRGGGGNFGVVVDFTFEAHDLEGVLHGVITLDGDLATLLRAYRDAMRGTPEELNATFLKFPPMGPEMPGGPSIHVVWAGTDVAAGMAAIQPLLDIAGVTGHDIQSKFYDEVLDEPHPPEPGALPPTLVGNNGFAPQLSDEAIAAIATMIDGLDGSVLMIRYVEGAFNRVATDATAFAWRDAEALVIAVAFLPPNTPPERVAQVEGAWAPVAGFTRGMYGNFETTTSETVVSLMYPPATRGRLAAIKSTWDPENVFSQNQNITPAVAK